MKSDTCSTQHCTTYPARCTGHCTALTPRPELTGCCATVCVRAVVQYYQYNEYINWCSALTKQLNTSTVWIMCCQSYAPPPIVTTCNGYGCLDSPADMQKAGMPAMWTEDWVAWFESWGGTMPTRDTRLIAYGAAVFFATGGTYHSYYMVRPLRSTARTAGCSAVFASPPQPSVIASHLCVSARLCVPPCSVPRRLQLRPHCGRTRYHHIVRLPHHPLMLPPPLLRAHQVSPSFLSPTFSHPPASSYDYNSALDEWGVPRNPKYQHAARLHTTLARYADALLSYNYSLPHPLAVNVSLYQYGVVGSEGAVAFLRNSGDSAQVVTWQGKSYTLAAMSVQIVDATTLAVVYDSDDLSGLDTSPATADSRLSTTTASILAWYPEPIGQWNASRVVHSPRPLEQINTTRYDSIYLWYSTTVTIDSAASTCAIGLSNAGDHEHFFLDGHYLGTGNGAQSLYTWKFALPPQLQPGRHQFSILSLTQGLKNYQVDSDLQRGLNGVVQFNGVDVTNATWRMQAGLQGEYRRFFTEEGAGGVRWNESVVVVDRPMTWYRALVVTPKVLGDSAYATWMLDMHGMTKGSLWCNGFHVGAYWNISTDSGEYSQRYYHVPRDYVQPEGIANLVVLLEEVGGQPSTVALIQRNQRALTAGKVVQSD